MEHHQVSTGLFHGCALLCVTSEMTLTQEGSASIDLTGSGLDEHFVKAQRTATDSLPQEPAGEQRLL